MAVSLLALALAPTPGLAQPLPMSRECVVLLHGLGRTSLSMKALQWRLEKAGYVVINLSYPSLALPIEELAHIAVESGKGECRALGLARINFVTHSLGGILVRQYLALGRIDGLHRVVMLGPPNQGSQLADFFNRLALPEALKPPAITRLGTGERSLPRTLGPVDFELGVIDGTFRNNTLLPGFPDEVSDGTVALTETVVQGMSDFLTLSVTHTFMAWNIDVQEQVIHFLKYGAFDHTALSDRTD